HSNTHTHTDTHTHTHTHTQTHQTHVSQHSTAQHSTALTHEGLLSYSDRPMSFLRLSFSCANEALESVRVVPPGRGHCLRLIKDLRLDVLLTGGLHYARWS